MREETLSIIQTFLKFEFRKIYNFALSRRIWSSQSVRFREFWEKRIMTDEGELCEDEMIPAIQILDIVGKRRNEQERAVEGVAFTNIYQGTWYDMFRDLKANKPVKILVDKYLKSTNEREQIETLNKIQANGKDVLALTGENGTIVNALSFAFNPENNISVVTLSDRYKIINFFELGNAEKLQTLSWGESIVESRRLILSMNSKFNIMTDGRGICKFLYAPEIKRLWKQQVITNKEERKEKVTFLNGLRKHDHLVGMSISFRDMEYAPTEENGVIFLFSKITNDLGIKIVSIQKHFPDAEAIKYDQDGKGYRVYIEFEFLSSDFLRHGHLEKMRNGKPCDLVVCWEHDTRDIPKEIEVLELKKIIKDLPKESV